MKSRIESLEVEREVARGSLSPRSSLSLPVAPSVSAAAVTSIAESTEHDVPDVSCLLIAFIVTV